MAIYIVLPVYNEEKVLEKNTLLVRDFMLQSFSKDEWKIMIADNASYDKTPEIARSLTEKYPEIESIRVFEKGKGAAIKTAWEKLSSETDSSGTSVYVFMDADLSADIRALPLLVRSIQEEGYDIAVGSRFIKGSEVERPLIRKLISYGYRLVLKFIFGLKVKDAPCGLKAVSHRVVRELLPQVKNRSFFFDTELLILAETNGYRIKEVPVHWVEEREKQRKSKVKIFETSIDYLKEVYRLRKRL